MPTCFQARQIDLYPWKPHDGRRDSTLTSSPVLLDLLLHTHHGPGACAHTCINAHTQEISLNLKKISIFLPHRIVPVIAVVLGNDTKFIGKSF